MVVISNTIIIAKSSTRKILKGNMIAIISSSDKKRKIPYLKIGIRPYLILNFSSITANWL